MSRVKFGDVVKDVKINIDRLNNPYEYYVAGDHMDSEDLTIHRKGCFTTDDVGPAFIRVFKPGQILYGSRRTYLKKIAVADFEGVCANTTFVFETKDPHAFEQRLLPFIMLSKDFTTWSIAKSKGSTNPYVLFSDLADFEFELPPLEEQKVLVDKLWAAYRLKEAYKKLLVATDEMVKSQFIEMFGDPQTNDKDLPVMHINEVVSLLRNGATIKQNKDREGYPITRIETIANRTVDRSRMGYAGITDLSKYEDYILQDGDILMSHINSVTHMGKSAIYERSADENIIHGMNLLCLRPKVNIVMPYFLYRYFQMDYFYDLVLSITKKAVNQASMTIKDLGNLTLIVPDMESQMLYVDFVRQSDKSKFALQEAIKDLDALSKKIIAENLIPVGKE